MSCNLCGDLGRKTEYFGESARTSYDRGEEHWNALESGDTTNPLAEHMELEHPEETHNFSLKVVSVRKSPLVRQCKEGLLIGSFKGDLVLNRKGEWGNNLPPAMTMEDSRPKRKAEGHRGRPIKRLKPDLSERRILSTLHISRVKKKSP